MSEENTDIFTGTTGDNETEGSTSKTEDTLFSVGEREYTVEAAKTKIEHADQHIKTLEQENADLRNTAGKIDEVLDALKAPTDTNNQQTTTGLSQEDVLSIIENRDAVNTAKENRIEVGRLMKERFGDKVKEKMTEIGQQLSLGPQTLQGIAEKSPKAFMALFPAEKSGQDAGASSSTGTINSEAVDTGVPSEGTFAYYEKMRKETPDLYNSASVQKKMIEDANRLGQEVFMGRK